MTTNAPSSRKPFGIPGWAAACLLGGVALFFAWTEHRAHLLGALPYLLFLACPLAHLLMHRGHGHEQEHGASDSNSSRHEHCHHEGTAR